jgi:hypothetical protein
MVRTARLALADMRAAQTQQMREELHGGAFYGAGMVGGGATPSMGLSQFRGGAMRGCGKHCRGCEECCDESSSDEDEMNGGSLASALGKALGLGARASTLAARLAQSRAAMSSALALRPSTTGLKGLSGVGASRSLAARLAIKAPTSTTLTVRNPGTLGPVRPAAPVAPVAPAALGSSAAARTVSARLAAMGITPARVLAALAAGVALGSLVDYFTNNDDSGYYDETAGTGPRVGPGVGPIGPIGPGGPGGVDGLTPEEEYSYLKTGNIPYRYLEGSLGTSRRGGRSMKAKEPKAPSKSDGRSARAAIVRQVMREQGLSLPAASKYVKENGLY